MHLVVAVALAAAIAPGAQPDVVTFVDPFIGSGGAGFGAGGINPGAITH